MAKILKKYAIGCHNPRIGWKITIHGNNCQSAAWLCWRVWVLWRCDLDDGTAPICWYSLSSHLRRRGKIPPLNCATKHVCDVWCSSEWNFSNWTLTQNVFCWQNYGFSKCESNRVFCKAKALRPLALSLSSGIILCIPSIVKHGIHVCAKLMTRRWSRAGCNEGRFSGWAARDVCVAPSRQEDT